MLERIFVLSSKQTIESGQSSVSNLPASLTSLIGREQEVRAACALLRRPEMRLLTLTGPGGIGKTRLGIQVATELLDVFTDGVYFVSLALINDPDLVIASIAQALGLQETGEQSLFEGLKASLWDKDLLLLLDNLEQVLAAAPHLVELLRACPKLKMLVTSRAVLRVYGEHVFPVLPLTLPNLKQLPDSETLMQCAAVTLFIQRVRTSQPNFQVTVTNVHTIAEICTRLDGLPLAIELAAARIKLLPPQALLARLEQRLHLLTSSARDVPARQQTLRNAITWSYNLLDESEQRLFRRLCVFVGGCTLEAAEAVCTALGDRVEQVLDGIAALIDKSLLYRAEQRGEEAEEPRLQMLETIREYGLECLAASGETAEVKCAHARYFLALVQELESKLAGEERFKWLDRLEHEHDNLRAALRWSIEQAGVGKTGCDIGDEGAMALWEGALKPLWLVHNHQDAFAVGQLATQEPVIIAKQPVGTFLASAQRPTTTARMLPPYPTGLTPREAEILRLVAQGMTDAQVAEQLVISPRTVNWHLSSIYSKLGVSSRSAATRYAIEHTLV